MQIPTPPRPRTGEALRAGGYKITRGSAKTGKPNFRISERRPWLAVTTAFLRQKIKSRDPLVLRMTEEATAEFNQFEALHPKRLPRRMKKGGPLMKAQSIVAHILKQGRARVEFYSKRKQSPLGVLTVALAVHIMWRHWPGTPRRDAHYGAVQIGRAIHHLLRAEFKEYEQDNGRGSIRVQRVRLKQGLTSRYVCQRLQQIAETHYAPVFIAYGSQIASKVLNETPSHLLERCAPHLTPLTRPVSITRGCG